MKLFNFYIKEPVLKDLKKEYKRKGFTSIAEYIRHLIDKRKK